MCTRHPLLQCNPTLGTWLRRTQSTVHSRCSLYSCLSSSPRRTWCKDPAQAQCTTPSPLWRRRHSLLDSLLCCPRGTHRWVPHSRLFPSSRLGPQCILLHKCTGHLRRRRRYEQGTLQQCTLCLYRTRPDSARRRPRRSRPRKRTLQSSPPLLEKPSWQGTLCKPSGWDRQQLCLLRPPHCLGRVGFGQCRKHQPSNCTRADSVLCVCTSDLLRCRQGPSSRLLRQSIGRRAHSLPRLPRGRRGCKIARRHWDRRTRPHREG